MSWNKPSSAPQPPPKKSAPPSLKRGLLAGLVVVALGALGLYLFSTGEADSRPLQKKDRGLIKEVTPAKAPTNATPIAEKPATNGPPPRKVGEYRDGYVLLPNGKLHRCYGVITNSSALKKAKYEIFDHKCENEIAMLLTIKPGQVIGPSFGWGGAMTKDFLESLKHPIIPTAEDTPENAELKRAVNQAKIELKAAYDRGEDIEKIFLDERAHFQKLMRFKDELVGETSRYRLEHPEATPQDVEDYCNAANRLLESKGIAPTIMGPISKEKFRMEYRQRRLQQQNQ